MTADANLPHRIAAGAIVIHEGKVLLVRYLTTTGSSYLAAPGGRLEQNEAVSDAAVRETLEETGLRVAARKVLCIEDLLCHHYKMCKVWILCELIGGELKKTEEARIEGIVEAGWYAKDALKDETVFPSIITKWGWSAFAASDWQVICLGLRPASI
jgi:8-oxo-dGTP diphosphatase